MKVLLIPNYARKDAVAGARSLAEWLDGQGVEVQWAHDKKLFPIPAQDIQANPLLKQNPGY